METITITLCDCAENHVGMEKIGLYANMGFSLEDLIKARTWFKNKGANAIIYDLNYPLESKNIYPNDEAYILIVKNGVDYLLEEGSDGLFDELIKLKWDSKAFMYGRVVNKHARHNLCFGKNNQEPAYEIGKGRIISWNNVPLLKQTKNLMVQVLGSIGKGLVAEGNYYYDVSKCGIGYHGDAERKKVIGIRLGASMPLVYQWYIHSKPVGERMDFELDHGDIYFMSDKATGNDFKKKLIYTLRHAAGSVRYTHFG